MNQDRKYIVFSNDESFTEVLEYLQKEYPDTWKEMIALKGNRFIPLVEMELLVKFDDETFNHIYKTLIQKK